MRKNNKRLGKTGIYVSPLAFGTMTFGDGADEQASAQMYGMARDHGINVFDCANVYAGGESERILGKLIQPHRSEIILASKAYYPMSEDLNDRGLSRRHLTLSLHASLKRLQTDYLDIFYLHAFDRQTPLEETLQTVDDFVRSGKVLYVGISNFAAWQIMKAIETGKRLSTTSIHCIQPMYNVLKRQVETEIFPMAQNEDLGVFTYGPLAGGLLTGKYLNAAPTVGRFNESADYRGRYQGQDIADAVRAFVDIAQSNGHDPVALAIAWTATHPAVTAPLIGARTADQLQRSLKSMDIKLNDDVKATLDTIVPAPALATDREEERASSN